MDEPKPTFAPNWKLNLQLAGYDVSRVRSAGSEVFTGRTDGAKTLAFILADEQRAMSVTIPAASNLLN